MNSKMTLSGEQALARAKQVSNWTAQDAQDFAENIDSLKERYNLSQDTIDAMVEAHTYFTAQDDSPLPDSKTVQSNALRVLAPRMIEVLTTPSLVEEVVTTTAMGNWFDKFITQSAIEYVGEAKLFSAVGKTDVSASFNINYETRGILAFEGGITVNKLEALRNQANGIDIASKKRVADAKLHKKILAKVALNGYTTGASQEMTYGLLNDPNLPAYDTASNTFSAMTFKEIYDAILNGIQQIQINSGDNINTDTAPLVCLIASDAYQFLETVTDQGKSVKSLLAETKPNLTFRQTGDFNKANGGASVLYIMATTVDGTPSIELNEPTKYMVLGQDITAKGMTETSISATSGVFVLFGLAFYRLSGIA